MNQVSEKILENIFRFTLLNFKIYHEEKFLRLFFPSFLADLKWLHPFKKLYASEGQAFLSKQQQKCLNFEYYGEKIIFLTKIAQVSQVCNDDNELKFISNCFLCISNRNILTSDDLISPKKSEGGQKQNNKIYTRQMIKK